MDLCCDWATVFEDLLRQETTKFILTDKIIEISKKPVVQKEFLNIKEMVKMDLEPWLKICDAVQCNVHCNGGRIRVLESLTYLLYVQGIDPSRTLRSRFGSLKRSFREIFSLF